MSSAWHIERSIEEILIRLCPNLKWDLELERRAKRPIDLPNLKSYEYIGQSVASLAVLILFSESKLGRHRVFSGESLFSQRGVTLTVLVHKLVSLIHIQGGVMYRPRFICIKRVLGLTLFIFLSWTIAGAYTIVFHGGKRVQIPDDFIVTSDAVIYETAPGVNVSFRLNSIDVVATERLNNEPSGSFLNRIGRQRPQPPT